MTTAKADVDAAFDFGMTDLEEQLSGPQGDEARRTTLARLDALALTISTEIDAGVSIERRQELDICLKSLAAARDIVIRFH
jgi:hypothetical protein